MADVRNLARVIGCGLVIALGVGWTAAACRADEVRLAGGDTLTGTIVERDEARLVFEHPVLGRLEIPLEHVASFRIDRDQEAAEPNADQDGAGDAPPPADPGGGDADAGDAPDLGEKKEREWKSHFDFGGNATFGNTDTQGFHVKVGSMRETAADRTTFDAAYFYGASNGDRTTSKFTTGVVQDWLMPESRWFFFGTGRYDYDEFQSWEHRLGVHGGPGYRLIKTDSLTLDLRAGAGISKEWKSEDNPLRPEALLGTALAWQITDRQRLSASSTAYPDLGERGEFRVVSSIDWSVLLDAEANMSLTAGLRNEYQSDVDPDVEHNDIYLFAGLKFDF